MANNFSCMDLADEGGDDDEAAGAHQSKPEFPDLKSVYKEEACGGIHISFTASEEGKDEETTTTTPGNEGAANRSVSFKIDEHQGEKSSEETSSALTLEPRGMNKVPTIASESDLRRVEAMKQARRRWHLDPRKARALRRKLYVDLYREAAGKGFI